MLVLSLLNEEHKQQEVKHDIVAKRVSILPGQYLPEDILFDPAAEEPKKSVCAKYFDESKWKDLKRFYNTSFTFAKWQTIEAVFANEEKTHYPYARFFLWTWEMCLFLLATAYTASLTNFLIQRLQLNVCTEFGCMGGKIIAAREGSYTVDLAKDLSTGQAQIVETRRTLDALWMVYNKSADGMIGCSY